MDNDEKNNYEKRLLDMLTNRINRLRRQSRVPGADGERVTDDLVDETGLDENNHPDIVTIAYDHLLDCNHPARNNLGGRCHICDELVCKQCIGQCSSCGLTLCPSHATDADFGNGTKKYCRECATEIRRSIKIRSFWYSVLSFFISTSE